jgi:hypothetical protein
MCLRVFEGLDTIRRRVDGASRRASPLDTFTPSNLNEYPDPIAFENDCLDPVSSRAGTFDPHYGETLVLLFMRRVGNAPPLSAVTPAEPRHETGPHV